MSRRRRRATREIAFSFDSFLDVVANVVGIILRLILVAWVGARSYSSLTTLPRPASSTTPAAADARMPEDPLQQELAQHRRELAEVQARLLEQLQQVQEVRGSHQQLEHPLEGLVTHRGDLDKQQALLDSTAKPREETLRTAALPPTELAERRQKQL